MIASTENIISVNELTNSNTLLTYNQQNASWIKKSKIILKRIKCFFRETTVEPCLFMYMLCTALSAMAVQNMHLEKSCRVNYEFGDEICDRIRDLNTTGLENELNQVQSLVAKVIAWKFPLQTAIPAVMVLFIGAWSDKYKKRKICILFPFTGEIITNIGLLFATYYFKEFSLIATALIEALPAAFSGSYIIIFMGMYSFMADRTTIENRTFRLGIVTIFISFGTPTGTALSGILLRALGYYGVFSLLLCLHILSLLYGVLRLEDVKFEEERTCNREVTQNTFIKIFTDVFGLVGNTVLVALKPRVSNLRLQIFLVIVLYLLMVGPLYGSTVQAHPAVAKSTTGDVIRPKLFTSALKMVFNIMRIGLCLTADRYGTMMMSLLERSLYALKLYFPLLIKSPDINQPVILESDSQVSYLYARRKFNLNEVEYSIYGTSNILLGLIGTMFCISVLSKKFNVQDSAIGGLAGVSRIAACLVFAFAPNRHWYYAAPVFNIFSHTGLTAVRSIATKSVPTEDIAKLSALMGVTEAIAPSIYMPTSSFIYVSTIDNFPGAFYLFDAVLTIVALGIFSVIYVLVKRRTEDTVFDPSRKQEYARSNEVSRF